MTTERKCPDCGCCCDYSSPCCNLKGGNADHPGGCKKITSGNLYISSTIGTPAVLEQLAEESADLAQAALKFARKLRDENPTPKSEEECLQDLLEELADVKLCMEVLKKKTTTQMKSSKSCSKSANAGKAVFRKARKCNS